MADIGRVGTAALACAGALVLGACGWQGGREDRVADAGGGGEESAWTMPPGADDLQAGAGAEAAAVPPMPDTSRLQPAQIIDHSGFGQPVVAADLEIPAGWQAVGGVAWNDDTDCVTNQMQIGWTAMAPDSLTAIEILPGFSWQVAGTQIPMNPCPAAPYRSTREFLEATVQRTRPGAHVLDYAQMTDVEQKMEASAPSHPQQQKRHDAGRLLIAYDKDGVDMREILSAAVTFTQAQGNVVAGTASILSQRAPNGRLDMTLGERIGATMKANPQWMQAVQQRGMARIQRISDGQRRSIDDWHNREMAIINARGAADRHAIRMRGNQEVAGIYSAIAANTSSTNDAIHRRTLEGIGEYGSYAGTDGGTVQSSIHGGSRVFQDNANPANAWSTDDPYAQPSNATELEPIP